MNHFQFANIFEAITGVSVEEAIEAPLQGEAAKQALLLKVSKHSARSAGRMDMVARIEAAETRIKKER